MARHVSPGLRRKWVPAIAALMVGLSLWVVAKPARANPLPSLSRLLAVEDPEAPPKHVDDDEPPLRSVSPDEDTAPKAFVDDKPLYKNWWFWALTGGAVIAVTGLAVWGFGGASDAHARPCDGSATTCLGGDR